MITYFSKKIKTDKDRAGLIKSLDSLRFKDKDEYFTIFPFCFFDSKFYSYLRQKRKSPYSGVIDNDRFLFERQIRYAGTNSPRVRTIYIDGEILDQNGKKCIRLNFKTNLVFAIELITAFPFCIWLAFYLDSYVWTLIVPIIILNEMIIIINNIKRIKKTTTA